VVSKAGPMIPSMKRFVLCAAVLAAAACSGSDSNGGSTNEGSDRLTPRDEPLEIVPLGAKNKAWPPAATSTVTLTLRAQVTPPSVDGQQLYASSVAVSGNLALVSYHLPGAPFGGAVDIIDITDPAAPVLVSSHSLPGEDVNAASSDGSKIYLAVSSDAFPFENTAAVRAYDLSANQIQPGSAQLQPLSSFSATDVLITGGRLFATTGNTGGHLIELDPAALTVTSSVPLEDARSAHLAGTELVVHRGGSIECLNDTTLAAENNWTFTHDNDTDARAQVVVSGEKAFVTAGSEGVHVLDATTGAVLDTVAVPTTNTAGLLPGEAVSNGLALIRDMMFIAQGGGGFHLAFTDRHPETLPANTVDPYASLSEIDFGDWESSNAVATSNDVVVVANGVGGVRLIALNHLADTPVTLASTTFGSTPAAPLASITLTADVVDAPLAINRVEFYAGSKKVGEDATAPYELTLTNLTGAFYDFKARAVFNGGYAKDSATTRLELTGIFRKISFGEGANSHEQLQTNPDLFYEGHGDLPAGYVRDVGDVYGPRAAGYDYGWSVDRTNRINLGQNRNHTDRRFLEGVRMNGAGTEWELDLPSGDYYIHAVAGYNHWYFRETAIHISAEGLDLFNRNTTRDALYTHSEMSSLSVTDGRLTLRMESGDNNTTLNFIDVMTAGTDYQPPSIPAEVTPAALQAHSMILHWAPSTDNMSVSHYNVYQDDVLVAQPGGARSYIGDLEQGQTYVFEVSAVDLHDNESARSAPVSVTTSGLGRALAQKTAGGIRADGIVAETAWATAVEYTLDNVMYEDGVGDTPTDASDLSVNVKILWDNTRLYLLVDVTDEVIEPAEDGLRLYFDFNNDRTLGYDLDSQQLFFVYDSTASNDNDLDRDGVTVEFTTAAEHYATVATATGWRIEMALPWDFLDVTGSVARVAGERMGFAIEVTDGDSGSGRDHKLSWSEQTYSNAWTSPQLMGTLELVE